MMVMCCIVMHHDAHSRTPISSNPEGPILLNIGPIWTPYGSLLGSLKGVYAVGPIGPIGPK